MTPRFFDAKVTAYENRLKYDFENMRAKTYLICAYSGNMKKSLTPQMFWRSPFEKALNLAEKWEKVDPELLANFNRNADDTLAQMRQQNGDN